MVPTSAVRLNLKAVLVPDLGERPQTSPISAARGLPV